MGEIKRLLDRIVEVRGQGNKTATNVILTKLILKGLNPANFQLTSPDDPATLAKVRQAAAELGINL